MDKQTIFLDLDIFFWITKKGKWKNLAAKKNDYPQQNVTDPVKKIGLKKKKKITIDALFWYWCYYLHPLRDSVYPVCGICFGDIDIFNTECFGIVCFYMWVKYELEEQILLFQK